MNTRNYNLAATLSWNCFNPIKIIEASPREISEYAYC